MGASIPNLKSRTARLDDTRDSRVIYTGYAFNATKKKGIWKGYMEEERGLTGSGVTERWLESGAAWSGMRPPAVAGRGVVAGSITSSRPPPTLPPCRPSPFRPAFVAESHSQDALIVLVGGPQVNP
jgi:hypothetical protein